MRGTILTGYILIALWPLLPATAHATCGKECDTAYSSDIDDCRLNYGDDPADAEDLARCIRDARDDYRSYLDDCAREATSLPSLLRVTERALPVRGRSFCRGPASN